MPRQSIQIGLFDKGIVCNPDSNDIPQEAAYTSLNVDSEAQDGILTSLKGSLEKSFTNVGRYMKGTWLNQDAVKKDLVFIGTVGGSLNLYSVRDFYGAPVETQHDSNAYCVQPNNKEVHIGKGPNIAPKWLGYVDYGQFGNAAPSGLQFMNGALNTYSGSANGQFTFSLVQQPDSAPDGSFPGSKSYNVAYSLIYDVYQESPLTLIGTFSLTTGMTYLTVNVVAKGAYVTPSSFNSRISGIKIYIAEGPTTYEFNSYRLCAKVDMLTTAGWSVSTDDLSRDVDIIYEPEATYEAETGLSEVLTEAQPNYGLSLQMNGYLFVGNCGHSKLQNASTILFKSKYLRYNMFDWTQDILQLPFIPRALCGYQGRLFAFGEDQIARINPDLFYIEEMIENRGIFSDTSVISVESGMYWCDKNGAYLYDGQSINHLDGPIHVAEPGNPSWLSFASVADRTQISVAYCAQKRSVIFLNTSTGKGWMFNIAKQRWDYMELPEGYGYQSTGLFSGKDGEVYYANGNKAYALFQGATYLPLSWTSKKFVSPEQSQRVKWYKFIANSSNVYYEFGTSNSNNITMNGTLTGVNIASQNRLAKRIQVRFYKLNPGTDKPVVNDFSLIFRPLEGMTRE